jgi:hypothetical protein
MLRLFNIHYFCLRYVTFIEDTLLLSKIKVQKWQHDIAITEIAQQSENRAKKIL